MRTKSLRQLVFTAMIAAIYTVLCLAFAPLGFGPVQARVAEALTILPVFSPVGVWGITLGCAVSNLVGAMTGMNILGYMDILFGTLATFLAALLTRKWRHIKISGVPVLSALPPVVFNAVIIGAELAYMSGPREIFLKLFLSNAAQVGAGQIASCMLIGLPLAYFFEKTKAAKICFGDDLL